MALYVASSCSSASSTRRSSSTRPRPPTICASTAASSPGIRPGKNTADYLDYVLTRLTVVGAVYLAAVCVLPEILISQYSVPFYFGGTSLLIVVSVTMDTVAQIHSHLLAHQYEGLIKKAKLRGTTRMNLILLGPPGRRQGDPGQAARGDATASFSSPPATCCGRAVASGSAPWPEGQGDHGRGPARLRRRS